MFFNIHVNWELIRINSYQVRVKAGVDGKVPCFFVVFFCFFGGGGREGVGVRAKTPKSGPALQ